MHVANFSDRYSLYRSMSHCKSRAINSCICLLVAKLQTWVVESQNKLQSYEYFNSCVLNDQISIPVFRAPVSGDRLSIS